MGNGPQEARALQFYLEKTFIQFQTYFPDPAWGTCMMQRANSDSAIRHALMALSAYHEQYVVRRSQDSAFALCQYNLAIKGLMVSDGKHPPLHTPLLSCLCFTYIEVLQGHYANAIGLFKNGCKIIQDLQRPKEGSDLHVDEILRQSKAYLYRLGVQIMLFQGEIGTGIPSDAILVYLRPSLLKVASFKSFSEAQESILEIYLRHFEITSMDEAALALYGKRLQEWQKEFNKLIAWRERVSILSTAERKTIALLELHEQYISLNIRAVTPPTGVYDSNLLKWDKYADEFSDMVDNAAIAKGMGSVASSGDDPQFHMHFGVTHILTSIITRCRDPDIRRRAIAVLAAKPVQEGVFSSDLAAKIAGRIVALEEGEAASCKDIPEEARLLSSSLHVGSKDTQVIVRFTSRRGSWEEAFETGISS